MPDHTPPSRRPGKTGSKRSLVERVEGQVLRANKALERRDGATRPKIRRRTKPRGPAASTNGQPTNGDTPAAAAIPPEPLSRELRALRSVYHDLGARHRRYREETGENVAPALRAAVTAFKQEPSLITLVPVAGFLDELDLLDW